MYVLQELGDAFWLGTRDMKRNRVLQASCRSVYLDGLDSISFPG